MTITIELPKSKKEAGFVLHLLKKLKLVIKKQETTTEDLKQRLKERISDLEQHPEDEISLEVFEKIYYQIKPETVMP